MNDFKEGEYIVYVNGDKYELGRIVSLRDDGACKQFEGIHTIQRQCQSQLTLDLFGLQEVEG